MGGLVDWSPEPSGEFGPGIHLGRVAKCELRKSEKTGSRYFNVQFVADDPLGGEESTLCFDVIMLEGRGRSIGQGKLKALGFEEGEAIESSQDLIGRRAWLACARETYNGKERLKVDISADGSLCGYFFEDQPPPEAATSGVAPVDSIDVPF